MLAVILAFVFPVNAISAKNAVVIDTATGRVLFERNADTKSLIASTTKIMTALVVCEQTNVLDRVRIPNEAVGIEGSSIYLKAGEVLTVQELLYGMMLHSGNDAAMALAIYCGGTIEGFVEIMNDKARDLGLLNTHFENPHGLDGEAHYSTAQDLAVLASYAMQNPIFTKIVSTKTIRIGDRYLHNHNKLLWQLEGAEGIKTGYTKAAGRILVSSTSRNGRRIVAVTICAPDDWNDHRILVEEGFSEYQLQQILWAGQCLGEREIAGGEVGMVKLIAADDFFYPIAENECIRIVLPEPGFVYAPIARGQKAGDALIYLNDRLIGKIPLIYGETIEQQSQDDASIWGRLFGGSSYDR